MEPEKEVRPEAGGGQGSLKLGSSSEKGPNPTKRREPKQIVSRIDTIGCWRSVYVGCDRAEAVRQIG